jgi:hypothetical protein
MGLYDLYKKQPAKEHVAVYLSFDVMQQLVMYAEKLGTKVSPLIRIAVMEKLEELKKQFGELICDPADFVRTRHQHIVSAPAAPVERASNPHETVVRPDNSPDPNTFSKQFDADALKVDTIGAKGKPAGG